MTGEGRDFLPSQKETERDKLLPVEFLKSGPTDCGLVGGKVDSFSKKPIQDNGLVHVALHEAFSIGSNFALTKGDPSPDLVIREEPFVSLAHVGRVGKKWKKITRNHKGNSGSGALYVGVKRHLLDKEVQADDGDSKEKWVRLGALVASPDSTVEAGTQPRR
ncbi:hypothetical protein ACSBR1_010383 [Camellia fascicularis]